MSRELDEIKKMFRVNKESYQIDKGFGKFGRLYHNTNENLKDYMPDLTNKDVLTVSASGDHVLNAIGKGAKRVDSFDINAFSPLFTTLKLYSIRYLEEDLALQFLNYLDQKIYLKFNNMLPEKEREIFDYIFKNFSIEYIYYALFYMQQIDNKINNNYFDKEVFRNIKSRLSEVKMNHFSTNLYALPNFLTTTYDTIFLSNISHYAANNDKFLNFIKYLSLFLNKDGEIYYAYLYEKEPKNVVNAIKSISPVFDKYFSPERNSDIIENTEIIKVRSAEFPKEKDSILIYKLR